MAIKKYHVSKNLWNEDYTGISGSITYKPLYVGEGTFTMSSDVEISTGSAGTLFLLAGNVSSGASTATNGVYKNNNVTVTAIEGYVTIAYRYYTVDTPVGKHSMLNTGSTALPYEPYGNTWNSIPYRKYGTETDTLTTLPADVIADGQSASADIIGNMEQTGTPTPTSPITPSECGERTENLFDKNATDTSNGYINNRYLVSSGDMTSSSLYAISEYIEVEPNTAYTFFNGNAPNTPAICFYDSTKGYLEGTAYSELDTVTVTSPLSAKYCRVSFAKSYDNVAMLNTGSTAKPYEPYGYKIPILSGGTTTNVYLGEVQSTRQIYKLVFTGQEDWLMLKTNNVAYIDRSGHLTGDINICYCSHYKSIVNVSSLSDIANGECCFNSTLRWFYIKDDNYTTQSAFLNYLQQQYSNGTPVTVWYVLATPTTTTLNEPIRKIGSYADSVAVSGVPTIAGSQTFDVDTTLKPSEVDLTYHGWHEHSDTKFTG